MKLSDLRAETETSLKVLDSEGEELGITIKGKTFSTREWRKARSEHNVDDAVYIYIEQKAKLGAPLEDNELKAVASLVTDITGLDDWVYSKNAVLDLFLDPALASIPNQWHQHLKSLGNALKSTKKKPQKKQKDS